jgi:hypothetical protein
MVTVTGLMLAVGADNNVTEVMEDVTEQPLVLLTTTE